MTGQASARGEDPARRPHAVLDLPSRQHKGMKIERLLGLHQCERSLRVLEIGTGSGGIAHYFACHSHLRCEVDAVDVCDSRQVREGFRYWQVRDVALPFDDGCFDVVISNHVIEHVGEAPAQCRHLSEIRRVLKPEGLAYLALPSRWMLVEPHFRLIFLSWLPRSAADFYVRSMGKGHHYDCRPLACRPLEAMLRTVGLRFEQQTGRALRLTYEVERPDAPIYKWVLRWLPDRLYAMLRRTFPTLIYVLRPEKSLTNECLRFHKDS